MKKQTMLLCLLTGALGLASCGGDSLSSSSQIEESSSSSTSSSSISSHHPNTEIDEAFLESLQNSHLSFRGKYEEADITSGEVSSTSSFSGFIGESSYHFEDKDDAYDTFYANDTYYKDEETGYVYSYQRTTLNEVIQSDPLTSMDVPILFDEWFGNPFVNLTLDDIINVEGQLYTLSEEVMNAFVRPFCYYSIDEITSFEMTRIEDIFALKVVSPYRRVNRTFDMEIKMVDTPDYEVPVAYEKESYHTAINTALTDFADLLDPRYDLAGLTYRRTRTPINHPSVSVSTLDSTIEDDAVLFAPDESLGEENPWGIALFDDNYYYYYEIQNGEVVQGEEASSLVRGVWLSWMVAGEMFEETDTPNTYAYRDEATMLEAVTYFLENPSEIEFLSGFSSVRNFTITLGEDGHLSNLSYDYLMIDVEGEMYWENASIDIIDYGSATIPYDFVIETSSSLPADIYGTWVSEDGAYTLEVLEDGSVTLNEELPSSFEPFTEEFENSYYAYAEFSLLADWGMITLEYSLYYEPAQIVLYSEDFLQYIRFSKQGEMEPPSDDFSFLYGSWEGEDLVSQDGHVYSVVIDENGLSIDGVMVTDWSGFSGDNTYAEATATYSNWGVIYITYSASYETPTITIATEDYSHVLQLIEVVDDPIVTILPLEMVGTWVSEDASHTLVISSDATITWDTVAADSPLEGTGYEGEYLTTINGEEFSLSYITYQEPHFIFVMYMGENVTLYQA